MARWSTVVWGFVFCSLLTLGCAKSSSVNSGSKSTSKSGTAADSDDPKSASTESKVEYWEDYPDVPKIPIMTEIDGIKIPRMPRSSEKLQLTGKLPADVGNELAKSKPSEPVTGDTLTVRFNAEPKVLNTITENSAVMQYIMQYVNDALARQNPETFEFEPGIAKKWIVEDSVKLSADYPGRERRIVMGEGSAQASIEFDYVLPPPKDGKPADAPKVTLKTVDKDGGPQSKVWVGVYPVGKIPGAPANGYHNWSDDKGQVVLTNFPTGKYVAKTGDELFGQTEKKEDGSVVVTPATPENPLKEPLHLVKDQWQDIQQQTYRTFYLRDDVKWADGTAFTTKDIEFGYALVNNDAVDGDSIRTYYSDLIECSAFGPHIVRLRYRQQYFLSAEFCYSLGLQCPPFHFFEAIFKEQGRELTLDRLSPDQETDKKRISAHSAEFGKFFNTDERYNSKPLGNGPYMVDKWERTDRVELVRNPNYWDPSKAGHVDRIIFKFIPDQVTALTALRAGEIDFLYDMAPEQYFEDWQTFDQQTRDNYIQASWYVPVYQYVGWNELANPLKDRRVRLALSLLFDRQQFIDSKMHGEAIVVSGTQYLFGNAYDNDVSPVAFSPETARDLLSNAGWIDTDNDGILDRRGEKFSITLRMPQGRAIYSQIAEVMQKNFKSVGIDLKIQLMEWASFIDKLKSKECDAVMLRWTMPVESDPFQTWHGSEAAREKRGSNHISFRNQLADELIEMVRVTLDEKKRHRIHQSFHRVLDSEQPYSFLWTPKEFAVYHKRFRNVKWYRLRPGFDLTEWYVPKDEQLHK